MSRRPLTPVQKIIINREPFLDKFSGKKFVLVYTSGEDRAARALEQKGYGIFQDNGWQYSWRRRSEYTNKFWLKEQDNDRKD